MASNNIARLGVILGIDTAEFQKGIDEAVKKEKEFARIIRADSNAAAKEIASLKYATDNYNKSLTKTEEIQYRISQGDLAKAEQRLKDTLLQQAAAYDKVVASQGRAYLSGGKLFQMTQAEGHWFESSSLHKTPDKRRGFFILRGL